MKKIRAYIVIVTLFLGAPGLVAQDTITINFNAEYHGVNEEGHGFMKLLNNGTDEINYGGELYKVTFPDQFFVGDTAIAFNYFTGWKNPAIANTTAFLFGNYTSHLPIVYVDYNHNLDFSDDGQPLKFNLDSTLTVYLHHSEMTSAFFPITFFYPGLTPEQQRQIEPVFATMGPDAEGNNVVDIKYWLADKRKNYKIVNSWLNGKAIKVGICDYNCNGLFNDLGEDRIVIGDFDKDVISGKLEKGAVKYSENVQIPLSGEVYEVVDIETSGKYLKLVKSNKTYHKPLGIGDNVGDLQIELITRQTVTVNELLQEKEFILLDFWGSWCKGCTQQLPDLKRLAKNSDNLLLVGLNYGDNLSAIQNYITKHDIKWKNGIANEEIMKKLRIDSFPSYLLIDKNGSLIVMNGTIEEIEKKLGN
ncbi:MAG: TlpA disulfide reductase family protein [Fulvivirga sp.]|nr:TlpA disulfide reductase family protein [Fulvivirga sp.]